MKFENTDELRGARFTRVNISGARFRDTDFSNVKIVDSSLKGANLSGWIDGLRINDVEVAPLIEAELDRRYPERIVIHNAKDPDAVRAAWAIVEERWSATIERARRLPEASLYERVDEEWSLTETLRHLIYATDSWFMRPVQGVAHPYHPFDLPNDGFGDPTWLGIDAAAHPTFDEVLPVRLERMAAVRRVVDDLTPAEYVRVCDQNPAPGYPAQTVVPVGFCLGVVLNEEWEHHQYAVRDLEVLERRT